MEVCTLSSKMILAACLNLYLVHYRIAFAFSNLPCPHSHQLSSRSTCLNRRKYGFTVFHINNTEGLGANCLPMVFFVVLVWLFAKTKTNHIAFWLESISIFDSSDLTRFIVDSHMFTLPSKPSSLPRNARSSVLPSRARLHLSIGLHCRSGFKHHITVNACTLRLLPEERQV